MVSFHDDCREAQAVVKDFMRTAEGGMGNADRLPLRSKTDRNTGGPGVIRLWVHFVGPHPFRPLAVTLEVSPLASP
jgi:hypothetical protein